MDQKDIVVEKNKDDDDDDKTNYNMNNIITLRQIAKNRGITFLHKTKDEIIKLLEEYDDKQNNVNDNEEKLLDYEKMNSRQLKELAKNRGFTKYNNMSNTNLRTLLKEYDETIEKKKQEEKNI